MWGNAASQFNVGAWSLWLFAAMLGALGTRNPFYLLLVILAAFLVHRGLERVNRGGETLPQAGLHDPSRRGFGIFLRAVIGLLLVVALFKGLSIHIGATVLFTLPEEWPVIGGPITAEGLAFAGLDVLSLISVLAVFMVFSAGADYYALLRSVPAFMHQVGLVLSIAITFVPQTVVRFTEIREAQALRGHKVRRAGDLLPLIMPLLAGGMERSMNLAEAMESRGFSRNPAGAHRLPPLYVQLGLVLGLGMVLVGGTLFALLPGMPWVAWGCIGAGVASIGLTLRAVGRGVKRSRYRRDVWRDRDIALAVASLAVGAILLTYKLLAPASLAYDPLSRLRIYVPPFDPVLAIAILGLAAPALIATGWKRKAAGLAAEGYAE